MPPPQNPYSLRSRQQQEEQPEVEAEVPAPEIDVGEPDNQVIPAENQVLPDGDNPNPVEVTMASHYSIQMPSFHGNPGERGDEWLKWYENYSEALNYNANKRRLLMPFHFLNHAKVWYDALPDNIKNNWDDLCANFKARFNGSDGVANEANILNTKQLKDEPCASYFTRFTRATANKEYPESILTGVVINGLLPPIKAIVMPQDLMTVEAVRKAACLAERTVAETSSTPATVAAASENVSTINILTQKLDEVMALNAELRDEARRTRDYMSNMPGWNTQAYSYQRQTSPFNRQYQQQRQRPQQQHQQQQQQHQQQQQKQPIWECRRCKGRKFHFALNCPANDKTCKYCQQLDHFEKACWRKERDQANK
ncbi:MAG: hypothetical protein AB2693_30915 [Candidatus Thiodiazotropha sp.]